MKICLKNHQKWIPKPGLEKSLYNEWARQPVSVHWSEPETDKRKPWWELSWIHVQHIPNPECLEILNVPNTNVEESVVPS